MPQRLNILFVTPWYPTGDRPYWGIFVREHAKAVAQYNNVAVLHTVGQSAGVAATYALTQEEDTEITQGMPTYVLHHRQTPPRTDRLIRNWSLFRALQTIINREGRPDVIHAHVHRVALIAVLIGKLYKIPVVVSEQHSAFPLRTLTRFEVLEAKVALSRAGALLPVSKALQGAIARYGIQRNFEIVPNVVDTDLFTLEPALADPQGAQGDATNKSTSIKLLCVANMPDSEVKGYRYLIHALAALRDRADWQLDIIGDGPKQAVYEQMVCELGLAERVKFHGYQPKLAIVRAMQQAALFVLASVWDNMPCVLIEAMATGLPIVATNVGGIPEVVTPEVGLLAEPGDVDSLKAAITQMIDALDCYCPERLAALAQQYSTVVVGQQLDRIYRTQIGQAETAAGEV
jgi:glycosyltransferase involved in cell wall biosynthesis